MAAGDRNGEDRVVAAPVPRLVEPVRTLIADHVESLEKLELLLLLSQRSHEPWTTQSAARAIRLPVSRVREAAEELAASGVVAYTASSGHVAFAPVTDALARTCIDLCAAYRSDPVEILKLASSLALARVRQSAATAFVDAFRLRRPREEGDDG